MGSSLSSFQRMSSFQQVSELLSNGVYVRGEPGAAIYALNGFYVRVTIATDTFEVQRLEGLSTLPTPAASIEPSERQGSMDER